MVEAKRGLLTSTMIKEMPFSVGDVVLVLRDVDTTLTNMADVGISEEAGIVFQIEQGGRTFIDYGGVVSLLHDEDQIRLVPDDIREALKLRLSQNSEELQESILKNTSRIRGVLEEWHDNDTFLKWLGNSVKSVFRKNKT